MSARALLPLIVLSILCGPVVPAMSAGPPAPTKEGPSSSRQAVPITPIITPAIIKPPPSGPQKEAPDKKPKKDPVSCTALTNTCLDKCDPKCFAWGIDMKPSEVSNCQHCIVKCNSISPGTANCKN
jgi:hypothetical protein